MKVCYDIIGEIAASLCNAEEIKTGIERRKAECSGQ